MKTVFLGGTCGESTWRDKLIPMLERKGIPYFDPVVPDWTLECQTKEDEVKASADTINLFVLTHHMKGVFSVAEVVDCSNKNPAGTILMVDTVGFEGHELKSLKAVEKLVRKNGAAVLTSLEEVVDLLRVITKEGMEV